MGLPNILETIDYIRLVVGAINEGRIEAKTVEGMTDEQIEDYITKLQEDAQAEIDRGREIDPK